MVKDKSGAVDGLDALIVRNLRDLDAASHRLYHDVQHRVGKAFDGIAESWAKKHGWKGDFDWLENDLWVAPPGWVLGESTSEDWLARFYLTGGPGDEFDFDNATEDFYWLTRLCGEGRGKLGFRWRYGPILGIGKPKWKKLVQLDGGKRAERIGKIGFQAEDTGLFFVQIKVEAEKLATGLEEDTVESALEPVRIALDRLLSAQPEFDGMMKAAKKGG